MFEGPFGRSPGRTKFAEPSNDRAVRFIQRWSKKAAIHFLCPFLACAFGEQGDQPARTPLHSSFRPCARLGKLPSLNADQRYDAYS